MTTSTQRPTRKGFTLTDAGHEFWKHPSPWTIGAMFVAALTARVSVGDWQLTDALVTPVMIAMFPFVEWIIHVFILHWRPKHLGRLTIDPLLARASLRFSLLKTARQAEVDRVLQIVPEAVRQLRTLAPVTAGTLG